MLLPLPVLMCGCVKGAGEVGRSISTELGVHLSPHGLVLGLAGAVGLGGAPGRGAISCWWPPLARFLPSSCVVGDLYVAPQPTGGCEAIAADV